MEKIKDTTIRIDVSVYKKAQEKAKKNGQSMKGYITVLIEKDVTQQPETTTQTTTRDAKAK